MRAEELDDTLGIDDHYTSMTSAATTAARLNCEIVTDRVYPLRRGDRRHENTLANLNIPVDPGPAGRRHGPRRRPAGPDRGLHQPGKYRQGPVQHPELGLQGFDAVSQDLQ